MNFSTNQVLQFYCVTEAPEIKALGEEGKETHIFFEIPNALGEITRTDIIKMDHILDVRYKEYDDDTRALKGIAVELNSNVNSGNPVAGQEYILRFRMSGTIGEECTYGKEASYVARSGDDAAIVLANLAGGLLLNLTEAYPIYELYSGSVSSANKLWASIKGGKIVLSKGATRASASVVYSDSVSTGVSKLIIAEPKPFWKLGTFPEQTMNFTVTTSPIIVSSQEVDDWAVLTPVAAGTLPNTHIVADMEYFAEGEKGADDVHGFSIITDGNVALAVDPTDTDGYNVLTVQFYHTGARDAVQKSERTLVIVGKKTVDLSSLAEDLEEIKETGKLPE